MQRVLLLWVKLHKYAVGIFVVERRVDQKDRLALLNDAELQLVGDIDDFWVFDPEELVLVRLLLVLLLLVYVVRAEDHLLHAVEFVIADELELPLGPRLRYFFVEQNVVDIHPFLACLHTLGQVVSPVLEFELDGLLQPLEVFLRVLSLDLFHFELVQLVEALDVLLFELSDGPE